MRVETFFSLKCFFTFSYINFNTSIRQKDMAIYDTIKAYYL